MLNLKRNLGQSTLIRIPAGLATDLTIEVKICAIDTAGSVKLGIEAPRECDVIRPEVNDPERRDRSQLDPDALIRQLFHDCRLQGQGFEPFSQSKWIELQALLQGKGLL